MELFVIMCSIAGFMLVVLVAAPWGMRDDNKRKRLQSVEKSVENPLYQELQLSFYERFIKKWLKKLSPIFSKFVSKKSKLNAAKNNEILQRQLRLAGMFVDPANFQFVKTLFMIIFMAVTIIVVLIWDLKPLYLLLILLIGMIISIMGPTQYLRSRVAKHQGGIKKQLPDAMDMICVCIEAGLTFDSSLLKVSEKLKGPFIDELLIVHREIQMGRTRREALQNLCNASNVEELKTFASALTQAEQLGIPINNVMKAQSEQLRILRSQEAKAKGMKASIKMLIPMLIFIFPVVFIILMGPTVMNIINTFK